MFGFITRTMICRGCFLDLVLLLSYVCFVSEVMSSVDVSELSTASSVGVFEVGGDRGPFDESFQHLNR